MHTKQNKTFQKQQKTIRANGKEMLKQLYYTRWRISWTLMDEAFKSLYFRNVPNHHSYAFNYKTQIILPLNFLFY